MAWTANLFKMTTGQIGPLIDFTSPQWSISLNGNESFSFTTPKASLPKLDYTKWLEPWWAGVVYSWEGIPIFGGPILSRPLENFGTLQITCGGVRSILAKRFVTPEQSDWTQIAAAVLQWNGLSLGTIAKKVVQAVQQKSGGNLPISYPIDDQTGPEDKVHTRTYNGFDIQNIDCDSVLTKISQVSHGPDIMFRPRLLTPDQLTFDMWYGSEADPRIPQTSTPVWDTTAATGSVSDMQIIVTGTYETNRVYGVGAGSDVGTLVRVAQDTSRLGDGYPLLETSIASTNETAGDLLTNVAQGQIDVNKKTLLQASLTVRADSPVALGTFWPGDQIVAVTQGWVSLPDGPNKFRLLNMNGSDTTDVKFDIQLDS